MIISILCGKFHRGDDDAHLMPIALAAERPRRAVQEEPLVVALAVGVQVDPSETITVERDVTFNWFTTKCLSTPGST